MKGIRIPKPPLFSFRECLWFLDRGYDDCMHLIEGEILYKAITGPDGDRLVFSVQDDGDCLAVALLQGTGSKKNSALLQAYVLEWLDMERDLQPFYQLLEKQPPLAYMPRQFSGLRLVSIPDLYEALCWSIIGQQINLKFAYALKRRLVAHCGQALQTGGRTLHLFPRPEEVLKLGPETFRNMQYSRSKALYVTEVSRHFAEGSLGKAHLSESMTYDEKIGLLTAVKGIGNWTANYALMKSLKDMQAIPHGDAGLLNALLQHGLIRDKKDTQSYERLFRRFKGWEAYLVFYLWRSLAPASFQAE